MILRFLLTIVKIGDGMEYAIGAYRVDAGVTTCLVGFLPAGMVVEWQDYEDRLAQVTAVKKIRVHMDCVKLSFSRMRQRCGT